MSTFLTSLVLPEVELTGANDQRLRLLLENTFPEDTVVPNLQRLLAVEESFARAGVVTETSVVEDFVRFATLVAKDLEAQCRASGQYPEETYPSDYFSLAAGAFFKDLIEKATQGYRQA